MSYKHILNTGKLRIFKKKMLFYQVSFLFYEYNTVFKLKTHARLLQISKEYLLICLRG